MFKNYLVVALRSLRRQRGFAAINVVGLAVGLACCLVIFQYVAQERSFDRFHAHADDLYRLAPVVTMPGSDPGAGAFTPQAMGPAMAERVPEIAAFSRLHPEYGGAVAAPADAPERAFEEERAYYVDPAFLEMFSFPLVAGEGSLAPGTVLLTETAAHKYFGDADAVGRELDWTGQAEGRFRVAGVLRDVPTASHLQFDVLLPVGEVLRQQYADEPDGGWSRNNFATYVQLRPGADQASVERTMTTVFLDAVGASYGEQGIQARMAAQPVPDIHLNADVEGPDGFAVGSARTVTFFTLIGLVTLLIALVNYVNLATARAADRALEVGVRKAIGAARGQLAVQFLAESALTVGAAAALAVLLAAVSTPLLNQLAETQLSGALWLSPGFWAAFAATLVVSTLLAGLYPAFVLSGFRPVAALKGTAGRSSGGLGLRRGLVVVQFAASVLLIAGTAVVSSQLRYMRDLDLGLDLEQVLTVEAPRVLPEGGDVEVASATLAAELRRLPAVRQTAQSSTLPGRGFNWNGMEARKVEDTRADAIRGVMSFVDSGFVALYGMDLVAGDTDVTFSLLPDSTEHPWALLANETAVRALGYGSPQDAIGEAIVVGDTYDARIVGVLKDFRWSSAHAEQQSIFLGRIEGSRYLSLRVDAADLPGTLAAVEDVFARLFPGNVFAYAFADADFDRQYREDQRFASLFTLFAGLAVAIACLGLFGLAAFAARQRAKEIGVRKVLGATVAGLVASFSLDFLKLVALAVVLAVPLAWWLMGRWLEDFAYHVELGPGVFVVAGAVALAVALATVGTQAIRAATADPVRALRSE